MHSLCTKNISLLALAAPCDDAIVGRHTCAKITIFLALKNIWPGSCDLKKEIEKKGNLVNYEYSRSSGIFLKTGSID